MMPSHASECVATLAFARSDVGVACVTRSPACLSLLMARFCRLVAKGRSFRTVTGQQSDGVALPFAAVALSEGEKSLTLSVHFLRVPVRRLHLFRLTFLYFS